MMDVGGRNNIDVSGKVEVFQDFFTTVNSIASIERLPVSVSSIDQPDFLFFSAGASLSPPLVPEQTHTSLQPLQPLRKLVNVPILRASQALNTRINGVDTPAKSLG